MVAVHRLMGNLAAWQPRLHRQAGCERSATRGGTERLFGSPQARAWLDQQGKAPWHDLLINFLT